MKFITIWALESDYDAECVGKLARKLIAAFDIKNAAIRREVGKKTYDAVMKKKKNKGLQIAADSYLENDEDKLIFVIDQDSPASLRKRRKEPNSNISRIENIMRLKEFSGKVFLALAVQELEAWLLTDCLGICCYFTRGQYKNNCRKQIKRNKSLNNLVSKYQKGNTELIIEPQKGGKGAKEYLSEYSKKILKLYKPDIRGHNLSSNKYRESLSPSIVDYMEIDKTTLRRNPSLEKFYKLIRN